MGKGKKGSGARSGDRIRVNPLTGETEKVAGTKAGKKRMKESPSSPLRTHDLKGPVKDR
jgi:hypothetical protein